MDQEWNLAEYQISILTNPPIISTSTGSYIFNIAVFQCILNDDKISHRCLETIGSSLLPAQRCAREFVASVLVVYQMRWVTIWAVVWQTNKTNKSEITTSSNNVAEHVTQYVMSFGAGDCLLGRQNIDHFRWGLFFQKEVSIYKTIILPELKTVYTRPPQMACAASHKQRLIVRTSCLF